MTSDYHEILPWIWTALSVVLTAASHVTFKIFSATSRIKYAILTGFGFLAVPGLTFLALRDLSVAQVYLPIALVPVLTTLGARRVLGERISWRHWVGLFLICGGVVLYQLGAAAEQPKTPTSPSSGALSNAEMMDGSVMSGDRGVSAS